MSATTAVQAMLSRRTPGPLPWAPLLSAIATAMAVVGLVVTTQLAQGELATHVAGLALAAAAGYLLDDPATAVTQAVPRPLWRRRLATVVRGVAVLTLAWMLLLALVNWRDGTVAILPLIIETAAIALIAVATAALLARHGEAEPGSIVAPAVAFLGIGALLLQPMLGITLLP